MTNPLYDRLFAVHTGSRAPFLATPDGGVLSYGAFLMMAAQFAHRLNGLGLEPGDRLALQVEKSPEGLALYAACVATGVVLIPLNTAYTPAELDYFIGDSGARLVICDPGQADALAAVAARAGARIETMDAGGAGSFADGATDLPTSITPVARTNEDLAAILYTSGTTGRSKGAMLSQGNLLSNALTLAAAWRFAQSDVLLHALPVFHTHGLFVATNVCLACGAQMIYLPRFDLDAMIAGLPQSTVMMGVPTFYTRLLGDPRFDADLAGHMRLFVSGSAPLLAETHAEFEARTGHRILERYGMTETNMNTSNPYEGERRAGTVGLPLPGVELKVCDADGTELPHGEIGVIEVRGPNVFGGYWQMPDKTAAELRADGFFITGDLGVQGADGYVTIVGRGKDLIISGGFNVYPKEVEEVLDAQAGVIESAVIGVPHPDLGETVVAVIASDGGADKAALSDACANALARFKHPRAYVMRQALPRNTMGKVQKAALRDELKALFTG